MFLPLGIALFFSLAYGSKTKEMIVEAGLGRQELQPSVFGLFAPQMQQSQRDIQREMIVSALKDVEDRPLQNVLLWGTGRAVGYGIVGP